MELLLTLGVTHKDKTLMDVLAQIAADFSAGSLLENETAFVPSISIRKLITHKLIRGAAKTVEFMGEDMANSVLTMFRPVFSNKLNELLDNNNIRAFVSVEKIVKEYEKVKVTIEISRIDYEGIINRFLPDIMDSLRSNDPENYLWNLYDVIKDDQPAVVKAVLNSISDDKKEAIIELMLLQYKEPVCNRISNLLAAQGIGITVDDISASAG